MVGVQVDLGLLRVESDNMSEYLLSDLLYSQELKLESVSIYTK
jgi:hypothetical protein